MTLILSGTNGVSDIDGDASTPALRGTDADTGIFFPAADTIGLAVGGVEAARVVSGLLSIPANSTAASAVRLYEDTDNGTNYVDIIAPSAITSDRTLTIPDASGTIDRLNRAGNVLQVVQGSYANITSTTSTSYVDTGLSASITPIATANKILVIVQASIEQVTSGTSTLFVIDRSGTKPQDPNFVQSMPIADGITLAFAYLDSPSSTSSLTYKIQFKNQAPAYTTIFGSQSTVSTYNTITLMEIAG